VDGGAFGGVAFGGRIIGGGGSGVGIVAARTGTAAAGVVAREFGRRLRGKWVLGCGVGRSGCLVCRRAWRVGRGG
jgi:hypothetical protein